MDKMHYSVSTAIRSCFLTTASARTLTYQGVRNNRNHRKDIANSAPGLDIINTTLERKEVSGGVTYNVYVVTFERSFRSSDGKDTVKMTMTATFRVPQAVIANSDIQEFASACWVLLASNGMTDSSIGISTSYPSQLESILLGSL